MLSKDETLSGPLQTSGAKAPLRTYSRHGRAIKRSSTALPEPFSHSSDLTEPYSQNARHSLAKTDLQGRKRRRATSTLDKTLTDVFWAHLSSSAPTFTHPPEMNHMNLDIPIEAEEDANTAPIENLPHSIETGEVLANKLGTQGLDSLLELRVRDTLIDPMASEGVERVDKSTDEPEIDEDIPQLRLVDDTALTFLKPRIKRGALLCFSPPNPKTRARRSRHVDESLSVVDVTFVSTRSVCTTSTARLKDIDSREFRKFEPAKKITTAQFIDGFERDETRPGAVEKRRRVDGVELSIGPLELTQKSLATQKVEGPTWMRGQKRPRVATAKSPWRQQSPSAFQFQIDSEEDDGMVQSKQSKSANQATRQRSKRHNCQIVSDDDEPMVSPLPYILTDKHNTRIGADVGMVRTSPENSDEFLSYVSDGDESVVLLVAPEDDDDGAALATIPRTDTPDYGADIETEEYGQLPPKEWMLNVLDSGEDTLALRPDPKEWTREVEIPDTSPRK